MTDAAGNVSLSARKLWIEIGLKQWRHSRVLSLSARKLWIEIHQASLSMVWTLVAFCEEAVD